MAQHHRFAMNLRRERVFRDRQNPLNLYTEEEVRTRYRFRPRTILFIYALVEQRLAPLTERSQSLPTLLRVLVALRFFATGAFQAVVGDIIQISKATVCR